MRSCAVNFCPQRLQNNFDWPDFVIMDDVEKETNLSDTALARLYSPQVRFTIQNDFTTSIPLL